MKIQLSNPIKEININPIDVISALSYSYDASQAEFINLFAYSLSKNIDGEHDFTGSQTAGIAENLDHFGKEFIKSLAVFIELIDKP